MSDAVLSEAAFHTFADALPDPLFLVGPQGEIVAANGAARGMLDLDPAASESPSLLVHAVDPAGLMAYLQACSRSPRSLPGSLALRGRGGRQIACRCDGARVASPGDGDVRVLLRCREGGEATGRVTALSEKLERLDAEIHLRAAAQASLEKALHEKEALLRELHHRVRNNLQVLLSILGLAARDETEEATRHKLLEMRNRVLSMAVVQKLLYQTDRFAALDGAGLLAELCSELGKSFGRDGIELRIEASPVQISLEAAAPFGLILNELVSNALRHAFPPDVRGQVVVSLRRTADGEVELSVVDSGRGMPELTVRRLSSGLNLARGLASQLGGELKIEVDKGTRCQVRFADQLAPEGRRRHA